MGNGGLAGSSNLFLNWLSHFPWNRTILEIKKQVNHIDFPAIVRVQGVMVYFLGPALSTMHTLAVFPRDFISTNNIHKIALPFSHVKVRKSVFPAALFPP